MLIGGRDRTGVRTAHAGSTGKTPGAVPTPLVECFNNWLTWTTTTDRPGQPWAPDLARGNGIPFITPGYVGGIESLGATEALQQMLLAVTGRGPRAILRLFPVWRTAKAGPASFKGLRAKGGFVVAASWDDVADEVSDLEVTATVSGPCALLSPWPRAVGAGDATVVEAATGAAVAVGWASADPRGPVLTFEAAAGTTYLVLPTP